MAHRLPRFSRAQIVANMEIVSRDRHLLNLVHQHRFLTSSHIIRLCGGSRRGTLHRLHLLYHHGFLERPRCQLDYYYRSGSRPLVYGLTDKGRELLSPNGAEFTTNRLSEKNRSVGRPYLEHVLCVADVMVALELACRNAGYRLISNAGLGSDIRLCWRVKLDDQAELGLTPDSVFSIEFKSKLGQIERAYFFLEADRGTMPIVRKNLSLSSITRKLLAYRATWQQNLHRDLFGFHRFRVLTVTTSPQRLRAMVDCCARFQNGHGLFLFADRSILHSPKALISAPLRTGKGGLSPLLG